jgi:hypothetical protein
MRIIVIVREVGRLKPDYSLDFDVPAIPSPGDYLSIHRPDKPKPYGEDLIVRQVWWRLEHPETSGFGSGEPKIGKVEEIYVECDPAVGPWSSDQWRDSLEHALSTGQAEELKVARLSVRQDALKP